MAIGLVLLGLQPGRTKLRAERTIRELTVKNRLNSLLGSEGRQCPVGGDWKPAYDSASEAALHVAAAARGVAHDLLCS